MLVRTGGTGCHSRNRLSGPNLQDLPPKPIQSSGSNGLSHPSHEVESPRDIVKTDEPRSCGFADLEQVPDVAAAVAMADIAWALWVDR